MNVDQQALTTIRTIRAQTDPIFIHTRGGLSISDEPPSELIVEERLDTIEDLQSDSPRRVAPWADTVYHLSESSLRDSMFVQDFRLAASAMFAFEKFNDLHGIEMPTTPLSWDILTDASGESLEQLLKHTNTSAAEFEESAIIKTLNQIRHALAWEQHQLFIESVYDELPESLTDEVPKAFWKQPDPVLEEFYSEENEDGEPANVDNSPPNAQTGLSDF